MASILLLDPEQLRTRRLLAGLTQTALAAKVGVHPISVTRYETGSMNPRPDVIARLARALGIRLDEISSVTSPDRTDD